MEGLIPYITEPREDTGVTNGKIGIWLFLASEVMLFGAFSRPHRDAHGLGSLAARLERRTYRSARSTRSC